MPTWKDSGALATRSGGTGMTTIGAGAILYGTGGVGPTGLAQSTGVLIDSSLSAALQLFVSGNERGRVIGITAHQTALSQNLSYNGAFNLDDISASGWIARLVSSPEGDLFELLRASAGSNPRTPTTLFRVSAGGWMHLGSATPVGATAGDFVLIRGGQLMSLDTGGSNAVVLYRLDPNNVPRLGRTDIDEVVAIPSSTGVPAASAGREGGLFIDATNSRLCYYVGGARYYIFGTSF